MEELKERKLCMMSFWSINDDLDITELKNQLYEMKRCGLEGVVFHPRYYTNNPPYLSEEYMNIVSELILYAKELNMAFWLYDEDGWPSGSAGGKVLKQHPELKRQWLELKKDGNNKAEEGLLYSFRIYEDNIYGTNYNKGELYHIVKKSVKGPSPMDKEAVLTFIEITHEAYKELLDKEAFDYVEGFFTDEVHFPINIDKNDCYGTLPWSDSFEKRYFKAYGEELLKSLPSVFMNVGDYKKVRVQFWEMATDALVEGFYNPLTEWGRKNNKKMTCHLKGEETPLFQLPFSGSCFQVLRNMTVPGIDALERYPGNNFYPRITYSLAQQFGNGECFAEAFGGSGWGIEPDDLITYMKWLVGHGTTHFAFHINQYRLKSSAIRDWPPSLPFHITWKEAFSSVLDEIRKKSVEYNSMREEPELLIVTPTRGIMEVYEPWEKLRTNDHNGSYPPDTVATRISSAFVDTVEELYKANIFYELTDERILENYSKVKDGYIVVGRRKYKNIFIPESCKWTSKGQGIINELEKHNVKVWRGDCKDLLSYRRINQETENYINKREIHLKQTEWKVETPYKNVYVPADLIMNNNKLVTYVKLEKVDEFEIVLLDAVEEIIMNSVKLHPQENNNRYHYTVTHECLKDGENQIEIVPLKGGEKNPLLFITGDFKVINEGEFIERNQKEVIAEGPFILKKLTDLQAQDLIKSGLPFTPYPIYLCKSLEVGSGLTNAGLYLGDINASAARVELNGKDLGWCWGPEWKVKLPSPLEVGNCKMRVEIYPNTFNVFGPHHHVDGDRHVVSPTQYTGVKNFADRIDAPELTAYDKWNFIKLGINGDVKILI